MALDPSIILSGRVPDIVGALDAGTLAGMRSNQARQQNALAQLYQEQGPGIMRGESGALNALAGIDPASALGFQQTHQQMAFSAEEMQMRRNAAKAAAQKEAAQMSADQRAAQAAAIESGLTAAGMAYQRGDQATYNAILGQAGLDPAQYPFEQFPMIAAQFSGVVEGLKSATELFNPKPLDPTKGAPSGHMFVDPANPAKGVAPLPGYKPTPPVQVNTGDNSSAFSKKADEKAAERYDAIVADGRSAQNFMRDLKTLSDLSSEIGTGKGAQVLAAIGPYAEALGVSVDGLGEAQAYQAIVDRLAPNMRPAGAGATSDFDAKQFLSSLPNLGRTPEGNALTIRTLSALQDNKTRAAEIANRVFVGELTWQQGDKMISELPDPYAEFKGSAGGGSKGPARAPQTFNGYTIQEIK